ncbi:MAG: hypothetical protein ACIWVG_00480, partial [Gloeotrichia echinulata HAB0833]
PLRGSKLGVASVYDAEGYVEKYPKSKIRRGKQGKPKCPPCSKNLSRPRNSLTDILHILIKGRVGNAHPRKK